MTVQPIRLFGDPVLRTPADPVVDFDKELRTLVADLAETMRERTGAGLAAPQIGVGLRVFTFDVDDVRPATWSTRCWTSPTTRSRTARRAACPSPALTFDTKRRQNVVATG